MIGAIAGDMIGSPYEGHPIKTKDFEIRVAGFTDDTVLTVAVAETFRDLSELEALRQELAGKYRVGDLTSRSPLMQRLFEVLPAIAASPSTVLIFGETGTGKELMARTIHSLSLRSRGPSRRYINYIT